MGAQSSKAARRLQPTVVHSPPASSAASAALRRDPAPTVSSSSTQQPIQQQQSDSPEIDAATKENFHKMNWSIKTTKVEADFKKDNEMLSILRSRKAAAVKANASTTFHQQGKTDVVDLEEYLWQRKQIPENKRDEFDAASPLVQRLGPDVVRNLRAYINVPDVTQEGNSGMGDTLVKSKWT
ncbi:hypothetical protein HDU79_003871 [Rhizoclosmatium sp. JEL0117]|nr:hypothetical protein HDU79_003871 [Rhizoclosmatium sp. JEL0117]